MTFEVLLSPPDTGALEQEYVLEAMRSGWVAPAGPDLARFEGEVATYVGRSHAVALSSGTAALHLALVSWGVGPGDVVPVSTMTFAASANAIRYTGATPWFVDAEPETGNINPELLDQALCDLQRGGHSVPVVLPVDLLGTSAQHDVLAEIAASRGVRVLTDAAESMGSYRAGRAAAAWGDAAALSFNGNKIMTTSGGGMVVTDDEALARHVRKLSTQAREPVDHYEHKEIGYNCRLSNVLAALGRAQLTRLDEMIDRRRSWRRRYAETVAGVPGVRVLGDVNSGEDNAWLTAIVLDPALAPVAAAELKAQFVQAGVEVRPIWKPLHLQPVFRGCGATLDGTSEVLFDRALTLPSGSGMSETQFQLVLAVLRDALLAEEAGRAVE
ncbi:MAG: aminotransferase class I/II-fold pyridoxal phosphate-dependent enzyme [Marmoricola sp.]